MRVLIVGGVAGGMSAATRLRRLDEEMEIVVIEKSGFVSYANCGLPYFVGGVIEEESQLLLQTPESLHARFRLDVRVHSEVIGIDSHAKTVEILDAVSQQKYKLEYDKLIMSPGAAPVVPQIAGIERAFTLRTVEDVNRIVGAVEAKPKTAVVIGGGFIGLEIAENLVHQGIATTIIEASKQVLAPLDPEMAAYVHDELIANGVRLELAASVNSVTAEAVILSNGQSIPAEIVIAAIGVRPEVTLASRAGLTIGARGGIKVNHFNQTSAPDIYAIGDAAEKLDAIDGSSVLVPLANIANRHGRVVADHICGREIRPVKTIGTAIVKVFNLAIAVTGWNEKKLAQAGKRARSVHTHPNSHAGYYPEAKPMTLKLIFDPETGEIFGAQGIGSEGVDKRIDVIATAMRGEIKAQELADLELAYAPPFGSAKDPVNMLGFIAENLMSGLIEAAQWNEVESYLERNYLLLDVRTEQEYQAGTIPGALNIPVDELRDRSKEISSAKVLVFCQVGQRGHTATLLMKEMGFDAINLDGGYQLWNKVTKELGNVFTSNV